MSATASTYKFTSSFDLTAADRAGLGADKLVPMNLDIPTVASTVFGTCTRLGALRADFARVLDFDANHIDKLRTYAEALLDAQAAFMTASRGEEAIPELVERAMKSRARLINDITALAGRDLIDGSALAELKGGPGHLNIALDVFALVKLLRENWEVVDANSAIKTDELVEAQSIAEQLSQAHGERTRHSSSVATANDARQRAYTLVVNAYEEVRRVVTFLRWHEGDANKLAPSLWAGRGGRGSYKEESAPEPETPAAAEPPPAPGAGLPGSNPFMS